MKICILSGSTLGTAEYVAEHLEEVLKKQGFSTILYHGANYDEVIDEPLWLIVTSTHGAGEIPDNLRPLFDQIMQSDLNLCNLRFAIVGLGMILFAMQQNVLNKFYRPKTRSNCATH